MTTPPRPTAEPAQSVTRRPGIRTTDKLLAGILVALVLLVAAVVALAAVVYSGTLPAPAATGPARHVAVTVQSSAALADVLLTDTSGISNARLGASGESDTVTWDRDVAFGQSIDVTLLLTQLTTDDDGSEAIAGSVECRILDGDRTLARTNLNVVGGHASCRWTNDGKLT